MKRFQRIAVGLGMVVAAVSATAFGLDAADRAYPPPLERALVVSPEVVDAEGALLRAFATAEGRWRLETKIEDVDPRFLRMLVAYEDRRFLDHSGVDPLAAGRAFLQLLTNGRVVSGASTLTMQVARLIEPRETRSLSAKLLQVVRAVQLERRLTKNEILELYLTHAPYGGNLEGVRAASLAYFGKEPKRLTVAEAALLVALPQAPEGRRPDRKWAQAMAARERVLARSGVADVIGEGELQRAIRDPLPRQRRELPSHAAHLAEAAIRNYPTVQEHSTTLRRSVQKALEDVAREAASKLSPKVAVAMVMADAATGEIIGEVGSSDYFDSSRSGWIDMTRVNRSPGSTLKPFIYGLAFEQGLVLQETLIEDRPSDFFGYRPKNFDMGYQGDVTVRHALQLSLNIPAVRLLDVVGPSRLMSRFRRAEVRTVLPPHEAPGLAIGLGGLGITLGDLVQAYAALANQGAPVRLGNGITAEPGELERGPLLEPAAAWHVTDILSDILPPLGSPRLGIAYKTGTSYGYRDAWSVGYDGRHVLGVWVGRADNGAVPGISGYQTAAPILFDAFARSGVVHTPLPRPPTGATRIAQGDLPISQRRFSMTAGGLIAASAGAPAPQIVYPPEGAKVDLGVTSQAGEMPLALKLQGGKAPFRWLANGRPLEGLSYRRTSEWRPDGAGYATLTVIDAAGRAASVRIFVE